MEKEEKPAKTQNHHTGPGQTPGQLREEAEKIKGKDLTERQHK